jgi:hypothetical protein
VGAYFFAYMLVRFMLDDVEAGADCMSESMYMYYVNDGVYGSFNCILFDHMPVEASVLEV